MNIGKKDNNYLIVIIGFYGLLLLFSWVTQHIYPVNELPNQYEKSIQTTGNEKFTYLHLTQGNQSNPVVIMPDLIHDIDFLIPLAKQIAEKRDVYVILYNRTDITAVGEKIEYTTTILDSLKIEKAHFMFHGYGSVTGLNLYQSNSDRFDSLVLLSAFGISELHLFGNHTLNKGLYGLQFFLMKVAEYALPHFGWFYNQPIQPGSIKAFYSMDLREMKHLMGEVDIPVLILHTENDNYVNKTTAEETFRLIPHSDLVMTEGNHFSIKEKPDLYAESILNFIGDAESDLLKTRETADSERIAKAEEIFDRKNIAPLSGFSLMFILILLVLFPLISEDMACIGAGLLVAKGVIGFFPATAACFTGIFLADVATYALGRWVGNPVLKWIPFRWIIKEKDLIRAEDLFEIRGMEIIFASRFIPGIRLPAYLLSGMIKARFSLFIGYFVLSILIYTPLLVGLAALFGQPLLDLFIKYQDYAIILLIVAALLILGIYKVLLPLLTVRGRRKLYMQWLLFKKRFINTE
jgi:membrane protein DedA with SNARE-associated domain